MLSRKGQSTLEYVIVLTAIIAAVLLGVKLFTGKIGQHGATSGIANLTDKALTEMTAETKNLPGAKTEWK